MNVVSENDQICSNEGSICDRNDYPIMDLNDYPVSDLYNPICDPCDCVYLSNRFWIEAEYLGWQIKRSPEIVPLVFSGIFDAAVQPTLKTAGTTIVLGDRSLHGNMRSGFKVTAGYNFCGCGIYSTDISYFYLGKRTYHKSVQSNDFPESEVTAPTFLPNSYLAIPFFDVTTGKANSVYIAKPGSFSGKAILKVANWMQGAEWNFNSIDFCCINLQIQVLAGFRYWNFNDRLTFTTHSPSTTTVDVFTIVDKVNTNNNFYGGQIGFDLKYVWCRFFCHTKVKLALGAIDQQLRIEGDLFTNDFDNFGAVVDFPGGYFAQPSNIGNYHKTKFAYIPELTFNMGYEICDGFSIKLGYSFLYVSKVFWAENQIDSKINPTQSAAITRAPPAPLTGINQPKALLNSRDFWAQGFNIGIVYQF